LGFGIVFQIRKENLLYAALGGALTRIVYLCLMAVISERALYVGGAAFFASAYAEYLANKRKIPATVILYPSIIPLIPGDLFYYTVRSIVTGEAGLFRENAAACILALVGISIGFVLSSTISYYIRYHRISQE
jgi:uncharacterized membrane protein YjjB (DUF3815 family)